ncbi:SUMF1/EgtB/PvdO family nonheme iron enzyme [Singulisphaera sp. Ch08]|uniref:SUMF1/EgtB/PvdO family nonheme iron enzyme n=1 Tax=Singulisphaera sp. Ch08 TaxID=3120278 RepID=A0AAU7CET7_9BACT
MNQRHLLLALGLCQALAYGHGMAFAAERVQLLGWDQPAVHFPGGGRDSFELTARTGWPRGLSGQFALRIVLPLGQVETQPLRVEPGQSPRRIPVYVPASAVRNLRPASVLIRVSVLDPATNAELSNAIEARIDDFPHPRAEDSDQAVGPIGWGTPLAGPPGEARLLPRPGPEALQFVRVPGSNAQPGFFIATTEVSNAQAGRLLSDYDPRAGRSDEFLLESPAQPAIGLTPRKAQALLAQLGKLDRSGVVYRLPTVPEWDRAARAGRSTRFWWGEEPLNVEGANFLGSEPTLPGDTTASTRPGLGVPQFQASPWHLFHTFGNAAEWATAPPDGFARLGGHFRTEPAESVTKIEVSDADSTGPDPYVGVRPVFDLDAQTGSDLVKKTLAGDPRLAKLEAQFDPDRATVTLQGTLPESSWRALADRKIASLWFVAAVENRVQTPTFAKGQLARLGGLAGPVRRITPLGRWFYEVPLEVRWSDPLPVSGTEWWVNVYLPGGGHMSHRLATTEPDRSRRLTVMIDRSRMSAAGLAANAPVSVALSLGGEAANSADPRVVSNLVPVRWQLK